MKKIMLLAPLEDQQSGQYILDSIIESKNAVAPFDFRALIKKHGEHAMNHILISKIKELQPEYLLVLKGLELDKRLFDNIKQHFPNIILINWIFDVTLNGTFVENHDQYLDFARTFDYFFTISKGSVKLLRNKGVNAYWCPEGCHVKSHDEVITNHWQNNKFGSTLSFIGSIGSVHDNRMKILERAINEGFDLKIWGFINKNNEISQLLLDNHTNHAVINEYHSIVAQNSKINIGIDGWPSIECSMSARIYRVLCAGGFLLTTHTKGIEQMFTPGVHLDTYKTEQEMIDKIYYYLENPTERQKIAKQGQELVKQKYKFSDSLSNMFNIVTNNENSKKYS